jgi:hypothetical protein
MLLLFAYWPFHSQSTIPSIDEVVTSMTDIDPLIRSDTKEAKDRLGTIVDSMAPEPLLIKPDNIMIVISRLYSIRVVSY